MSSLERYLNRQQKKLNKRLYRQNAKAVGVRPVRWGGSTRSNADDGIDSDNFSVKVSSVLGGVAGLVDNYNQGSSIQDTNSLEEQINQYGQIGSGKYNTFEQLASDYSLLGQTPDIDEDDIRGMSDGQKLGTLASGMATGAAAGAAFGGIGAAVGAGIGAITSGIGLLNGNNEAEERAQYLNNLQTIADRTARINLSNAHEDLLERNQREGLYNLSAHGGQILRKTSLKEFTDKVLNARKANDVSHSAGIVRTKCNGGTMIRIKMK